MGDPHQFRLPFSTQPNPFANDSQTPTTSHESPSSQSSKNIFSSSDVKPVFGSQSQNVETSSVKSNVFGGSSFSKPNDNPFGAPGRANIFGGTGQLSSSSVPKFDGHTNVPQSSSFGKPPAVFGGISSKPDTGSIFGGVLATTQKSDPKSNPFADVQTAQTTSISRPSIFGGSSLKNEENPTTFSISKPVFEGFPSASNAVTSTRMQEKSDFVFSNKHDNKKEDDYSSAETVPMEQTQIWEPDSVEEENRDNITSNQSKESTKSTKINRKRCVFGQAIADVEKVSSGSTPAEEYRSIICHPSGDLADISVLKDHFSKFGLARVSINKEKQYVISTYKTHEEAFKAKKGSHLIAGERYKCFGRNMSKPRRRSLEEAEKLKSPEEKKQTLQRTAGEIDPSVREELEAISGIDYLIPENISSKRKSIRESEFLKRSRTLARAEEVRDDGIEKRKRSITSVVKPDEIKSRAVSTMKGSRSDDKTSLRNKRVPADRTIPKKSLSSQDKNERDESKSEKVENSTAEGGIASSAATSELLEILKQQALSSDDKLRVLEARDKFMRLRKVKQYDISKAVKTVGTCPDMCPEKERLLRESRRQISQYEIKGNEMDPSLMVKQYSRSSADQEEPLPHELRPPAVLTMTMNYLMHGIMNRSDEPGENLGEWYHFLWDRLRGIRKEITQQELCDLDAVRLVEQCARFHIHCGARLVAEDMSVFDDRINTENLTKCLQTLKHMYHDLWMNNSVTCPNEPEFVTYFLLLNLNNGTIMWEMEQLREEVLGSPQIGFVASMYNSLSTNNFVRFFRLVKKASYLNSCLCIRYFYQVRAQALATLVKALAKSRPVQYPSLALVEELGFENVEQAATFCSHYGLSVENTVPESACVIILSQETFCSPDFVLSSERAFRLAESKKIGTVGEVVNGGLLPSRTFENHTVHNSFDENGFLHKNSFYAKDQGVTDLDGKDIEEAEFTVMQGKTSVVAPSSVKGLDVKKNMPQAASFNFGTVGNQMPVAPSTFSNLQPGSYNPFGAPTGQMFQSAFSSPAQSFTEKTDASNSNTLQIHGQFDPLRGLASRNVFVDQNQIEIEAQKKAQAQAQAQAQALAQAQAQAQALAKAKAELEATVTERAEFQFQELLQTTVWEATSEIVHSEIRVAQEELQAQERKRAEEQLRAQEEMRRRALETYIDKIANDSVLELFSEVVTQVIVDSAQEACLAEERLVADINVVSEESVTHLTYLVTEEFCHCIASDELRKALDIARKAAVEQRVKQVFYHWLHKARRSLHRRHVMEDFPASVIPLSLKEHAKRWGISSNLEDVCAKRDEKILDLPELKSSHPQVTFAELIGIQAVHRYDTMRVKVGLRSTDKLLYKLFVSVPEEINDSAAELVEWWIRRTFKQNCGILHDDSQQGVYRVVSGAKVTSEVAVYASLQLAKGNSPLEKHTGLASGTSAVLFSVSPTSNIQASRSRLTTLLKTVRKLPPVPLVVAVVCPTEPPVDGLKQLVIELQLDQWHGQGVISDYQILHVEDLFDLKYLTERFNVALNYMVMTWTPCPEFSLVLLKNVLKSTFQMFYISIQFNYNSSQVYPQDVDDPRVIIGLCNEWLNHMCQEFVESYFEAKNLCGEEFWPLLHKGAFLHFWNKPKYVELLQEVIKSVSLPAIEWPPSSEKEFETILTRYCSWLRPEELKHTQRRISCVNGSTWSEKLKSMPWVNLIEDWMEAKINYIETSDICGTELLCLMRSQNVEHLYTYPWWAQSNYITSYLETISSGRECEMDVDQPVLIENMEDEQISKHSTEAKKKEAHANSSSSQIEELKSYVSELKTVNESFLSRLHKAVADDGLMALPLPSDNTNIELDKKSEDDAATASQGFKSLVNTIDLQVKVQRDLRSHISNLLSNALSEEEGSKNTIHQSTVSTISASPEPITRLPSNSKDGAEKIVEQPSNTMNEIMASVNDIVASLNQKYKILENKSGFEKITDLKMGLAKVDSTLSSSENFSQSSFVEQSQRRMLKRLQGSLLDEDTNSPKKSQSEDEDSDLEVLSDERSESPEARSYSSPSSRDSRSIRSESDAEEEEEEYGDEESTDRYRDSDRNKIAVKKVRRHSGDSENNYSSKKKRHHHEDSEDASYEESLKSDQESECGSLDDDDEVQSISSEGSTGGAAKRSPSPQDDNCLIEGEHHQNLNPVSYSEELQPQNDLMPHEENIEGQILNLDYVNNYYDYYDDGTGVQDQVYPESSEGVLLDGEVGGVSLPSEDNNHVLLGSYEPNSENALDHVYEVEVERGDEVDDVHPASSDEDGSGDQYSHSSQSRMEPSGSRNNYEDSELEAYEELEEEAEEENEEHVEEEIEEEEEVETEVESEPDEDSDVCEVIDDDD